MRCRPLTLLLVLLAPSPAPAAELAVLTNDNWDHLAPAGKEADCILGDYALRSDRLMVVVGQPLPTRNANMTVREVGGAVIDLTLADRPNDQLGAFYPGMRRQHFTGAEIVQARGAKVVLALVAPAQAADRSAGTAEQAEVKLTYTIAGGEAAFSPRPRTRGRGVGGEGAAAFRPATGYELADGQPFLLVRSVFRNPFDHPLDLDLADDLRADNFDAKVKAGPTDLFWVHDVFFAQAYGLLADGHSLRSRSDVRNSVIEYTPEKAETSRVQLPPGRTYELVRRFIPGPHLLAVKGEAARLRGVPLVRQGWHFVDPQFHPVGGVEVSLVEGDSVCGTARTAAVSRPTATRWARRCR